MVLEKTTNILALMVSDHQSRRAIFESGALTALLSAVSHRSHIACDQPCLLCSTVVGVFGRGRSLEGAGCLLTLWQKLLWG